MSNFDEDEYLKQLELEFADTLEESLGEIEAEIVNFSKTGVISIDLTRKVHSMKGAGASFGLSIVSTICHQFEDQLAEHKKGVKPSPELIDSYLGYVDMLRGARRIYLDTKISKENRDAEIAKIGAKLHEKIQKSGIRILIAEESKSLLSMITAALNGQNNQLIFMNDGLLALSRALSEPFDVVVASGRLRHLDGTGVIAGLRYSGLQKIPKLFILTSNIDDPKLKGCGADDVFPKTKLGFDRLSQTISELSKPSVNFQRP